MRQIPMEGREDGVEEEEETEGEEGTMAAIGIRDVVRQWLLIP